MTGKKIEFLQKPNIKNKDQYIDNWVTGNKIFNVEEKKFKRTTIYFPEELHKKLKIYAANNSGSMSEIIIEAIEKYML